jgi:hypothetical protein
VWPAGGNKTVNREVIFRTTHNTISEIFLLFLSTPDTNVANKSAWKTVIDPVCDKINCFWNSVVKYTIVEGIGFLNILNLFNNSILNTPNNLNIYTFNTSNFKIL